MQLLSFDSVLLNAYIRIYAEYVLNYIILGIFYI